MAPLATIIVCATNRRCTGRTPGQRSIRSSMLSHTRYGLLPYPPQDSLPDKMRRDSCDVGPTRGRSRSIT